MLGWSALPAMVSVVSLLTVEAFCPGSRAGFLGTCAVAVSASDDCCMVGCSGVVCVLFC